MRPLITMREALASPAYFGNYLAGPTWANWRVLLVAIMGEPLDAAEMEIFTTLTGRENSPVERVREFWAIVGRRGGKSRAMGTLAAYIGGCVDHRAVLAPGERGVLPVLAASTAQARSIFNLIKGVFEAVPRLKSLVEGESADTLSLSSRVDISVKPASFRTIRSISAVSAIGDEVCFWRDAETSVNPDAEVIAALKPSLLTTGGIFVGISSPYARRGSAFDAYRKDYGPKGNPRRLVAKAPSIVMNPSLPKEEIEQAYADDPARAGAEYGAEFRTDVETYVDRDALLRCVAEGETERAPAQGVSYIAFVDPSGGSADSMTMAIAHRTSRVSVLDIVREVRPPFSPEAVVSSFATDLKRFGITKVFGDRYAGQWVIEPFARHAISYHISDRTKNEIYQAFLPLVNSAQVELLDHARMLGQFLSLDRRTGRFGRDIVDHPPGQHDDVANAVAGALVALVPNEGPSILTSTLIGHYRGGGASGNPRFNQDLRPPLPLWVQRGELYPVGDYRWKLKKGQQWLAARGRTE